MNQKIWGPHLWFVLHTMSFNYPLSPTYKDKKHYKTFIESLQYVLPCSKCRKNFKRNLRETPPILTSRKAFVYWLIDFHNEVNTMTGKKRVSTLRVIELYEKKLNKKLVLENISLKSSKNNYIDKMIIILILFLLGLLLKS